MTALILWGWAAFVGIVAPAPAVVESSLIENLSTFTAVVSAYSCDAHPANPMHPCGAFRDGSRPTPERHGLVAAGPYEWLGRTIHIEGYGDVLLVDTPRHGWYGDKPHIDLFLPFQDAVRWGIPELPITLMQEDYAAARPGVFRPVPTLCRRPVGACRSDDLYQRGDSLHAFTAGGVRP